MQRVVFDGYDYPLHCPFCGHMTIAENRTSPCEHTLCIATDETLEYCSERIKRNSLVRRARELGWDETTDKLKYDDSVKFALYIGGFGVYVCYAWPLDAEAEGS